MTAILDTHYVVALTTEVSRLERSEREVLGSRTDWIVSAVSIWELRIKWRTFHRSGEPKGPIDPALAVAALQRLGLRFLDLTAKHAAHVLSPPLPHRDPFDELLLAQAQAEGVRLLTRDDHLLGHPMAMRP